MEDKVPGKTAQGGVPLEDTRLCREVTSWPLGTRPDQFQLDHNAGTIEQISEPPKPPVFIILLNEIPILPPPTPHPMGFSVCIVGAGLGV